MRLIDADALLTILEREREYHEKNELQIRADGVMDAIMDVIDAPTIESERKIGKWIPQDHNRHYGNVSALVYYYPICSKCGKTGDYSYAWCPHCGARMDGEITNE